MSSTHETLLAMDAMYKAWITSLIKQTEEYMKAATQLIEFQQNAIQRLQQFQTPPTPQQIPTNTYVKKSKKYKKKRVKLFSNMMI